MVRKKPAESVRISAEFAERLDRFKLDQKVRVIILLSTTRPTTTATRGRQAPAERRMSIRRTLQSAKHALPEIDAILDRFNGRRFADTPNAVASIPVETTPAGVKELARLDCVAAVLEDQRIHRIP